MVVTMNLRSRSSELAVQTAGFVVRVFRAAGGSNSREDRGTRCSPLRLLGFICGTQRQEPENLRLDSLEF
jgi:hypothetical protein